METEEAVTTIGIMLNKHPDEQTFNVPRTVLEAIESAVWIVDDKQRTLDTSRGPALFYVGTDEMLYRLDDDDHLVHLHGGEREDAVCVALLDFVRSRFKEHQKATP